MDNKIKALLIAVVVIGGSVSMWMSISVLVANSDGTVKGILLNGGTAFTLEVFKMASLALATYLIMSGKNPFFGVVLALASIPMIGISLAGTMWQVQSGLASVETAAAQNSDIRRIMLQQSEVLAGTVAQKNAMAASAAQSAQQAQQELLTLTPKLSGIIVSNERYLSFTDSGMCITKRNSSGVPYTTKAGEACAQIKPLWERKRALESQLNGASVDVDSTVNLLSNAVSQLQAIDSGQTRAFSAQGRALESIAKAFGVSVESVKDAISTTASWALELALGLSAILLAYIGYKEQQESTVIQQTTGAEFKKEPQQDKGIVEKFGESFGRGAAHVAAAGSPSRLAPVDYFSYGSQSHVTYEKQSEPATVQNRTGRAADGSSNLNHKRAVVIMLVTMGYDSKAKLKAAKNNRELFGGDKFTCNDTLLLKFLAEAKEKLGDNNHVAD